MPRQPRRPVLLHLSALLCLIALFAGAGPGLAQGTCSSGNPARSVHQDLWGTWKPGDRTGNSGETQLPGERDSTSYTGNNQPNINLPLYSSIDIEGDWAFTSYATGIRIWNIAGGNAEKPSQAGVADIRTGPGCSPSGFFVETPDCSELKEFFWDIDAPPDNPNMVAVSGLQPVGLTIIDTTTKSTPRLLYQDSTRGSTPAGTQVYAATIGGRSYAFLGVDNGQVGLHLYDMTSASTLNKCSENTGACTGVYKGRIGGANSVVYVDGVSTASNKHYVVTSAAVSEMGLRIWNVTNPNAPVSVSTASTGRFITSDVVFGVAMWEQGNQQYLAIHIQGGARIYNVTNCLSGGCAALPDPVKTLFWAEYGTAPLGPDRSFVTFSRSGNQPMLYFGAMDQCSGGRQREFIFDVSNANSPVEVSSDNTMLLEGKTVDYWSWYYSGNYSGNAPKHGFSRVTPMVAKFNGANLYRAARTIFDVHVWGGGGSVPPVASFNMTPPSGIYKGDSVQFTDTSSGSPTSWSWSFPGGDPLSSTAQNPVVKFDTVGDFEVVHTATNGAGTSNPAAKRTVSVLDPSPKIGSVTTVPVNGTFYTCDAVTFEANSITGKPQPTVAWAVSGHPASPTLPSGNSVVVPAPGGTTAVTYTVSATPNNGTAGTPVPKTVTLNPPPALSFTGGPTNDPFAAGTVNFHVQSSGATSWEWDFGDGQGFRGGQYNTANPVFSYTQTGVYTVKVKIKNCGGELTNPTSLSVHVEQIEPVVIETFAIEGCPFGCPPGAKSFILTVTGGPNKYEYDWDGDGTFEDTTTGGPGANGKVTHTYTVGVYSPAVRVRRGTEPFIVKSHPTIIVESGGPPPPPPPGPSISISGPGGGQPNAVLSFSATASNCTPAANWSWSAAGGEITGNGSSSVTIKWASTGAKSITVTNSGCSGATGTKSVNIGDQSNPPPPPPPGGLAANFSWSPANPSAGQSVTFDGGSSTGAPSGFSWDFGGGVIKDGQTVTHTFPSSGTYSVKLEVVKPGNCALGLCIATTTKAVQVGGPTGPPPIIASFNTSAPCIAEFGANMCEASAGVAVTFTDTSTGGGSPISTRSWDFGDGEKATGSPVTHTFKNNGSFVVTLTVGNGSQSGNAFRNFTVTGGTVAPVSNTIVLPWIAQSRGILKQSSDIYVHNPGATAMEVALEFRKRGLPDVNPPRATRVIQPGATLYVQDVITELFKQENITGFVLITKVKGDRDPVLTSFNTTFGPNGTQFGQTVPGVALSNASAATIGRRVQYLVGLNDNNDREAYFGVTNPNNEPATYRLKFFNSLGQAIGKPSADLKLSSFGLKQFQPAEVRSLFGIDTEDDYRVEVETVSGKQLFPYGANVRTTSDDPSYLGVGLTSKSKLYLIGAMSTPGINNTKWQTDVVLSNTGANVALAEVSFLKAGLTSQPTAPLKLTLQPGQTDRLENVVGSQWNVKDAVGVIIVQSNSTNGVFPVVQGESYETSNASPGMRFGQFMAAFTDEDAAGPGRTHYLVGLRQDADSRTTFWLYNPSNQGGTYDLIYRGLDGKELGRISNASLGAGKLRQLNPSHHPLPAAGVPGGFTVQVVVKTGKVLAAAQVVNNKTNDPAYVQGQLQ